MDCPDCGGNAHRSHSRNFKESAIKTVSSYKTYRCAECGWRGMAAPVKKINIGARIKSILFWLAGLIIALIVGFLAIYDLQSGFSP